MGAFETITDDILKLLDQGVIPWRKPWQGGSNFRPANAISKAAYQGINTWMLAFSPFDDHRWLTYKQAQQLKGNVRKGERGRHVVYAQAAREDEEGDRRPGFLKVYTVFNVAQCEGVEIEPLEKPTLHEWEAIEAAERIAANMPAPPQLQHGGRRAYYQPMIDAITMPPRPLFEDGPGYYSTLFHEMGHSTMHPDRCNREEARGHAFGTPDYSREELVAELTSAYLLGECGLLPGEIENSAAYIKGWSRALADDKRMIITAASKAQAAANYILRRNHAR